MCPASLKSGELLAGKPPFIFSSADSQEAPEESPCTAGASAVGLFISVAKRGFRDLLSHLTFESFTENLSYSTRIHSCKTFLIC